MTTKLPKNARILLTLDNGAHVRLHAISPMLIGSVSDAIRERWAARDQALPEAPTYTITTAAGVEEIHEHDEASIAEIEDEGLAAKVLAALKSYGELSKALERERASLLIELCALDGVEVVSGRSMEAWEKIRKRMGRAIPADEDDRKIAYVLEYVISTPRDVKSILQGVLELSGVAKEGVEQAQANFRDPVEEGRPDAERPADQTEPVEVRAGEPVR